MAALRVPTIPNSPLASPEAGEQFGEIALRRSEALGLVENGAFDPALATYDDSYQNSQAHSPSYHAHMASVAALLKRHFPPGASLVEVGCGKGDFLALLEADGHFRIAGFDTTYEGTNPNVQKRYLSYADRIEADVVVLRHVLEHVQRPHEFLAMLASVFRGARLYIEVPSLDWIVQNGAFFDVTYEHVNYFSTEALRRFYPGAVLDAGLCFGDQYQFVIADIDGLAGTLAAEYAGGAWAALEFDQLFPQLRRKIDAIDGRLAPGRRGFLWGAATKGCMFLVHCANHRKVVDRIECAIDVNPAKCGKLLPGSRVPIVAKEHFFGVATKDDLLIIANPNYEQEIRRDLAAHGLGEIEIVCL